MHCLIKSKTLAQSCAGVAIIASSLLLGGTPAVAAPKLERVDIVKEGIDLTPIYVDARSTGYTGSENKSHKYLVRVYAKAKGNDRVWKVVAFGVNSQNGGKLFQKDVGRSEGWKEYSKSLELHAKPSSMGWVTTPKTACDNLLKKKMSEGMSKADVLKNDRKTTALALVGFQAYVDTARNNKKGDHKPGSTNSSSDNIAYTVNVVCRAAL